MSEKSMIIKNASEIARLLFNQFYKLSMQKKNIGLIKIFPQHFIQLFFFLFLKKKQNNYSIKTLQNAVHIKMKMVCSHFDIVAITEELIIQKVLQGSWLCGVELLNPNTKTFCGLSLHCLI